MRFSSQQATVSHHQIPVPPPNAPLTAPLQTSQLETDHSHAVLAPPLYTVILLELVSVGDALPPIPLPKPFIITLARPCVLLPLIISVRPAAKESGVPEMVT